MPILEETCLGAGGGKFITEEEFLRRSAEYRRQYMMGLLDCAKPYTDDLITIGGIRGNALTRMHDAPAGFENVRFEKVCEPPFVRIAALRDIVVGEETWVDCGLRYRCDVAAARGPPGAGRTPRRPPPYFIVTCR